MISTTKCDSKNSLKPGTLSMKQIIVWEVLEKRHQPPGVAKEKMLKNPRGPGVMFGTRNVLQKTLYGAMEVTKMTTNPMPRRGLGKIKFEAIEGEEAEQVARKFSLISNQ